MSEWKEECTHLVMLTVKVTVKVCAFTFLKKIMIMIILYIYPVLLRNSGYALPLPTFYAHKNLEVPRE